MHPGDDDNVTGRTARPAVSLFRRFDHAQSSFYAGGQDTELRAPLSEDITWHVPGGSPAAGDYRDLEQVFDYFHRRTMRAARAGRPQRSEHRTGPE
jgi:ketosteroid isomerase-like protein